MKIQLRKRVKSALVLLAGGMMLSWGGSCIPENFWYHTWDNTLQTTFDAAYSAYVLDPLVDAVTPAG